MTVVVKDSEEMELYGREGFHVWLGIAKLNLADEKAEAVLVTNSRKNKTVKIQVSNHKIGSKSIIR